MAIAPDGKTLASGAGDGSIWVWDIGTGRAIRPVQGLKGSFTAIAFAPDGKAFAAADDRGIWLGDTNTDQVLCRFSGPAHGEIACLKFSPDASTLASVPSLDPSSLWSLTTNTRREDLAGLRSGWCVAFAPDGKTFAIGDSDGTVTVYQAKAGLLSANSHGK
jgi:WD40 repeat protein